MINFRKPADMFVAFPRNQLAHYTDNTMPRRRWQDFDKPTCARDFMAPRFRQQKSERAAPALPSLLRRQAA